MQIDSIIGELLLRNNCVVVPNFGGFIASQTSAEIDFSTGKMSAPKKSILFNKQVMNNDGLLITSYASKFSITYENAQQEIDVQVKLWLEDLNGGKRITLDKVGFLYLDNEKNIRFEQDRFFNLLLQSFGMTQVQFIAEERIEKPAMKVVEPKIAILESVKDSSIIKLFPEVKTAEKSDEKIVQLDPKIVPITTGANRKLIRYIAAACILPIAFYSVWIPTKTDVLESGIFSVHDFNPFYKQQSETYTKTDFKTKFSKIPSHKSFEELTGNLPEDVSVFPLEIDNEDLGESNDIFYVRLKTKNTSIETPTFADNEVQEIVEEVKTKSTTMSSGKYKVVVGSFSNDNNANSLMNELKAKGFLASTYPESNGLIRVLAGSSNSNAEASSLVAKLNELQISSWILK